ncbi:hypothetical protein AGOR_G00076120 [Albula goreensis]|uniref:Insulin receptor substrate 2 n=1 Tax=Albula goreensis TaxID=1534307 RepID=A0A8T3DNK7_9TELE|nr:hypothetical protein AGOR_G00076120 [Albula goreensis]
MALDRLTPRRRGDEEVEEDNYAVMSRSASRESFTSRRDSGTSAGAGASVYLDVAGEFREKVGEGGGAGGGVDNGYMSMLPGVTAPPVSLSQSLSVAVSDSGSKPADDYMAMTPNNSVSPPQQIRPPPTGSDGYMMMSPNSSCSPDQRGMGEPGTPPPPEGLPHPEQHQQQPPPKMVYSYYSLPRSYKHMPPAHFEDDAGRGKRPSGSSSRGGGASPGVANHSRQEPPTGPVVGRHQSLSSSSYSSSSASSESLGESEEKSAQPAGAPAGRSTKDRGLQQRRVSGSQQQGQQQHQSRRPVSLFVDVSKANTLPRVRETPLPPEPKSPGEYVSIEFRADRMGRGGAGGRGQGTGVSLPPGPSRPLHRPTSCLAGFLPLPRSPSTPLTPPTASEYVNMDLGPSPSPSPLSLTPLGFPSFSSPATPTGVAPKARDEGRMPLRSEEGAEAGPRKNSTTESPTSCGDYTEMAFSLNAATTPSSAVVPKPPSPGRQDQSGPELGLGLGLDFPLPKAGLNPDQGAKVIRADPQGRRRHCSETFLASPPLLTPSSSTSCSSSSSSLFPEHTQAVARRLGFDSMLWGNGAAAEVPSQCISSGPPIAPTTQASSMEQGLNYIDLDLVNKENPHSAMEGPAAAQTLPSRLYSTVLSGGAVGGAVGGGGGNGAASNLNTYASIDFYKSEELRTHQNGSKDGTEC